MSGGQKIHDHGSWIGKGGKSSVLPDGVKHKMESSADGFGGLSTYEDTTEKIRSQQEMNKKKVHSHQTKPGFRN